MLLRMCIRFVSFIWQLSPSLEIQSCDRGFLISDVATSFHENIQTLCSVVSWSMPQEIFQDNAIFFLSHSCMVLAVCSFMIMLEVESLSLPEVLVFIKSSLYMDPFSYQPWLLSHIPTTEKTLTHTVLLPWYWADDEWCMVSSKRDASN